MGNKSLIGSLSFLMLLIVLLVSCDPNRTYEKYQKVDKNGWHQDSTIYFAVDISDTVNLYNLYVNIRNKGNYPNSNLWLFLTVTPPKGKSITDTVEFNLADIHGKWMGKGLGDLYDSQHLYKGKVFFPTAGTYRFKIQHGMRETLLPGIRDVGIRIEKIKKK
ncbi:MAG: gliding motility lipoprotein GldH [Bacteroidota bacterium]|nr:gliding motility lipoprotein GldH [Bacteroidota bacterium]